MLEVTHALLAQKPEALPEDTRFSEAIRNTLVSKARHH